MAADAALDGVAAVFLRGAHGAHPGDVLQAGQRLRRIRRGLDPEGLDRHGPPELSADRVAHHLAESPDHDHLHRIRASGGFSPGTDPVEVAKHPAAAGDRAFLDEFPHPSLCVEGAAAPAGIPEAGPDAGRAGLGRDAAAIQRMGGAAGHGLHLSALRHPPDLRGLGEIRLLPAGRRARPGRQRVEGLLAGLRARHPAGTDGGGGHGAHPGAGFLHHSRHGGRNDRRTQRQDHK